MADTETEIVNLGLDLIGEAPITDILAPTTERGHIASRQYSSGRDALLRRNLWVFARTWVLLTADTATTLDPDRPYKYRLPSSCVRVIRPSSVTWVLNGRDIYSAETPNLRLQILRNDMSVSEMDPLFVQALAAYVVLRMVERRTQSANKQQILKQHFRDAMQDAVASNVVEDPARIAMGDHASLYLAGHDGFDQVT